MSNWTEIITNRVCRISFSYNSSYPYLTDTDRKFKDDLSVLFGPVIFPGYPKEFYDDDNGEFELVLDGLFFSTREELRARMDALPPRRDSNKGIRFFVSLDDQSLYDRNFGFVWEDGQLYNLNKRYGRK